MSTVITFSLPNIEDVISVSFIIKLIRKTALKRMSEHVISQSERVRERDCMWMCVGIYPENAAFGLILFPLLNDCKWKPLCFVFVYNWKELIDTDVDCSVSTIHWLAWFLLPKGLIMIVLYFEKWPINPLPASFLILWNPRQICKC